VLIFSISLIKEAAVQKLLVTLLLLLPLSILYSQDTIHVPADYSTIQAGIDAASNGDMVLVADGTYIENINFSGKAITVASNFILNGDESHIENTAIDGSQPSHPDSGSVVIFVNGEDTSSVLCGFTITGGTGLKIGARRYGGGIEIDNSAPIIRNNIIEFNELIVDEAVQGSAIDVVVPYDNSTLIIENNIIRNNTVQTTDNVFQTNGTIFLYARDSGKAIIRNNSIHNNVLTGESDLFGGGISILGVNSPNYICYVDNNKIYMNEVTDTPGSSIQWGGGIYFQDVMVFVRNNIIAFNSAEDGGGVYYYNSSSPPPVNPVLENNTIFGNNIALSGYGGALNTNRPYDIVNCIIWSNSSPQYYQSSATITYSNIEQAYPNGSNNISLEPEFLDSTYFLLSNTSPCIDSGNPGPMYNDVEDPNNPGFALYPAQGTLANDIGHCGGPNSLWWANTWPNIITSVENDFVDGISGSYKLNVNYPNPFNPNTIIKYQIPEISFVTLKVYDVLGSEVATLISEEKDVGNYEVEFDATSLSSGIYFYRLRAGQFVETKKMVLMK
jgi:hypothetical protein